MIIIMMFSYNLEREGEVIWKAGKGGSINAVRAVLLKNDILFTRYAYCNKGGLFNQNLVGAPADKEKARILIPIRKEWSPGNMAAIHR